MLPTKIRLEYPLAIIQYSVFKVAIIAISQGQVMPVSEYLILFSSILIGLAIADLSLSLHKLLRARKRIRWNLIVPALGFITLCMILNLWWLIYERYTGLESIQYWEFLPQVLILVTFFLISAAVFPDEIPQEGIDLQEFYIENRGQIWSLFALFLLLMMINGTVTAVKEKWSMIKYVSSLSGDVVAFALALFLMKTKRMIFHWLMIVFLFFSIGSIWFYLVLE